MNTQNLEMSVREIIGKIEATTTLKQLNAIVEECKLTKEISEFNEKYPSVDLSLNKQELEELQKYTLFNDDHTFNKDEVHNATPVEKVLLAILWKNGHFNRVQYLVDGITGVRHSTSIHGPIFRQFGRSLSDPEEPIIDQHVLRAFRLYHAGETNESSIKSIKCKEHFTDADEELLTDYKRWFKQMIKNVQPSEKKEFNYLLDKIMFAVGKSQKN